MRSRTVLLASSSIALVAALASAQRDTQEESKLAEELRARSPDAVSSFQDATAALDRGDNTAAEAGYRQVLATVPDFVPALRRLSYITTDNEESLKLARRAYDLDRHGYNLNAVVQALLRGDERPKVLEAGRLAEQLLERLPDDPSALVYVAEAAGRNQNMALFRKAVAALRRVAPDEIPTHYYSALEAVSDSDWAKAESEIERAKALGFPEEQADAFLEGTGIRSHARNWRYLHYAGYASLAWGGGLLVLAAVGIVLSRRTLRAIEAEPPEATGLPSRSIKGMRRIYGIVLTLVSLYFYLSMPFVFVLVIGAAAGLLYAIVAVGYVPIKLVLVALILLMVTLWAMLKGLLARGNRSDPGERLEEKDAPALYSVLREVAAKVDTPIVDSVFLVPDATVAVFERGSTLKHVRHRGERCLLMGLGVLDGMSLAQLKAILAHEYGHLSNRDTAGGGLALQVRRSILASAEALASGGAAVWYNPAWLFLNGFFRLYLRISQGASRLQEVLADRWAVLAYGKDAFSSGLRHVVRRGIEFDFLSRREITHAVRESRPLHNLYDLQVPPQWSKGDEEAENGKPPARVIEEAYQEAFSAPTSDYDSHPAPAQRIAWVDRMTGAPSPTLEPRDAWGLFPEKDKLQELMTRQVGARLQAFIARQAEIEASVDRMKPDEEVVSLGLDSRKP